jgi:DNA repair exonuclease SbcCD nuclease subunit
VKYTLLLSDLHLTSAPRDEYRWQVFDQVVDFVQRQRVDRIIILGDLTDAKDGHPARLVNRIVDQLTRLRGTKVAKVVQAFHPDIIILRGNHDGIDPEWPYFKFLSCIEGIAFISSPVWVKLPDAQVLALPHSRTPRVEWAKYLVEAEKKADYILMHATVRGAESESGRELDSEVTLSMFKRLNCPVLSGDVHVPQRMGTVTYVGSPYHVHYGDKFSPRMLYLDKECAQHSIPLTNIRRWMLDVKDAAAIRKSAAKAGDQVKVRVHVAEADLSRWQQLRQAVVTTCRIKQLDVAAVELVREESATVLQEPGAVQQPEQILKVYMLENKTPVAYAATGNALLDAARKSLRAQQGRG